MRVIIVGGGAAGTLVAVHLLRQQVPVEITVIERTDRSPRGVAYSTTFPDHLLNVVAANMGGLAENPGHFREWLAEHRQPVRPTSFMPRTAFGDYLDFLLKEALDQSAGARFERIQAEAVGIAPVDGRWRITLANGDHLHGDKVVLATGVLPPRDAPLRSGAWPVGSPLYVTDPWAPGALDDLAPGDNLLLVGTGLTMVDVALRLIDLRPAARITAISRSGLVPQPHRWPGQRVVIDYEPPEPGTSLRDLPKAFRAASVKSYARGGDWRDVINAVRPYTQSIWKGLSLDEQRRFLRTYLRYWDIHRHRMAPAVAAWIQSLRDSGQLTIVGGPIQSVEERDGRLAVTAKLRDGGALVTYEVDAAINCTGPSGSVVGAGSPLMDDLIAQGIGRPHPLGLGLDTGEAGALRGADGELSTTLFTIGWLRRGELWESVAIPEIRAQAGEIATVIL